MYLKEWRQSNGWTQYDISELVGISQSAWCTYEGDASNMPYWLIVKLTQVRCALLFDLNKLFNTDSAIEIQKELTIVKKENDKLKNHILKELGVL